MGAIDLHPATPTQVRSILSEFFRFVNPKMTLEHLPRSLRIHPRFPERGLECGRYLTLYFHIGNAAKALQEAYAADLRYATARENGERLKDQVIAAIAILEARTALLERLAAAGPDRWVICGTDAEGFFLVTREEHDLMLKAAAPVVAQVAAAQVEQEPQEIEPNESDE